MSYKKLFLSLLTGVAALGVACSGESENANRANANTAAAPTATTTPETKVAAPTPEIPTENSDYIIELATARNGNEIEMTFAVKDKTGAPVKDFKIVHEKKMHLIAVSEDLAEFEHLHPELQSDGSFKIRHVFKHGGRFLLYPDVTPANGSQVVQRKELDAPGEPKTPEKLVADLNLRKTVENLTVTMQPAQEFESNREMTVNFVATDGASGEPARDLQNYLGELAHVVILSEDTRDFLHVHPMSDKRRDRTAVVAHTAFPRAGVYKIWAQFQRAGKVVTVPYVISVAEGTREPVVAAAKTNGGAIKIAVSGEGFSPAVIETKKGEPIKLLFTRTDDKNCGTEVVLPALNIKKELPVGQEVAVDLTPSESGEISFSCGMNMMKGKILAE